MSKLNIDNIDLGKIGSELEKYENQWVVVSEKNRIVGSGDTYSEALNRALQKENVVLFKVPSLSASLAP